jgi:hypothetical protein
MMRRGLALFVLMIAMTGAARAQGVWVGDEKSLTTDIAYHFAPSSETVISPDFPNIPDTNTQDHTITLSAEYVPVENLALEAELPIAFLKYTGTMLHLPPGAWDDHNFHTTLTDLRVGARYQVLDQPLVAVTPYLAVSIPVMNYEVNGFATGGRHLKQVHLGLGVGRTLDPILPALYALASYELTLSEKYKENAMTEKQSQTRSDVEAQLGYLLLDGDLNIAAAFNWRHQHGGVSFEDFGMLPPELTNFHDPILKESYMFLGANVAYAVNRKVSVGAIARFFLRGYNTRDQSLFGVDATYRWF